MHPLGIDDKADPARLVFTASSGPAVVACIVDMGTRFRMIANAIPQNAEELRVEVLEANLELQRRGLVLYMWGNASGIDRELELIVIKASGAPYEKLVEKEPVCSSVVVGLNNPKTILRWHRTN